MTTRTDGAAEAYWLARLPEHGSPRSIAIGTGEHRDFPFVHHIDPELTESLVTAGAQKRSAVT